MKSKKYPLIGIVLALLLVAGVTIAFASSPQSDPDLSAQQAVAQLTESIRYQEGQISFRLPEGYAAAENWNIQIAGRLELDGMDMSAHFLEEQNTGHTWEAGRTYRFAAEPESYTELTLYAALPNADGSWAEQEVDLLQRIG